MKYRLFSLAVLSLSILLAACGERAAQPDFSSTAPEHISDNTVFSGDNESQHGEAESADAVSSALPAEKPEFLASKYVLVSSQESFGNKYVCEYYFLNGKVAGMKKLITLPDNDAAKEYYEHTKSDRLNAELEGSTVIIYISDTDAFCYGYSLEKLEFVLEKSGISFELNFDKKDFYEEFAEESAA